MQKSQQLQEFQELQEQEEVKIDDQGKRKQPTAPPQKAPQPQPQAKKLINPGKTVNSRRNSGGRKRPKNNKVAIPTQE